MAGGSPDVAGLGDLLQQLLEDTREVARAEVALQKARLRVRIERYRTAAIYFAVAGALALAMTVALLVGLILALSTRLGPLGATAVVCGVVFIVVLVFALLGRARISEGAVDADHRP